MIYDAEIFVAMQPNANANALFWRAVSKQASSVGKEYQSRKTS
jgi:hypothetical protein